MLNGCMQNMASTKLNSSAPLHGVVRLALRTSTFNCSAAQKHIGYSPVVSLEAHQSCFAFSPVPPHHQVPTLAQT
ncbi:unnamed protein product [Camellia sinensis]